MKDGSNKKYLHKNDSYDFSWSTRCQPQFFFCKTTAFVCNKQRVQKSLKIVVLSQRSFESFTKAARNN